MAERGIDEARARQLMASDSKTWRTNHHIETLYGAACGLLDSTRPRARRTRR